MLFVKGLRSSSFLAFVLAAVLAPAIALAGNAGNLELDGRGDGCGTTSFEMEIPRLIDILGKDPCAGTGTSLVAHLETRALVFCVNGQAKKAFPVAHGSNGYPKTREGDARTPVGNYELGRPRRSSSGFGQFIPIQYPTPLQISRGLSGGDVGIHGPPRADVCGGWMNVASNWTNGCLALPSDQSLAEVARFVEENPGLEVVILAD